MINIIISIFLFFLALLIGYAGSLDGPSIFGYPGLMLIATVGFLIHWLVFIPSYLFKTEKYYDITGTIAYLVMTVLAVFSADELNHRSQVVAVLIVVWALRLGLFLIVRVFQVGEDKRFHEVKKSFLRFLVWFSMSALWVFLTTANALTVILNNHPLIDDGYFLIGLMIWMIGFAFEVTADEQKRRFRNNPNNKGRFIRTGLWSISRHPNYFGEILIWVGMAIISFPVLSGWQYTTLISPLFVTLLLTKVSGINLLEASSDKNWGDMESYQQYKQQTSVLVPFIK
jgi:steroid 5-alpha reductase family enzyme